MKKVLVAGGAGLLGSHLYDRLLNDGHDVLRVDSYFTGTQANIAKTIDYFRTVSWELLA
jgi:UDP-glucuronate decarboxylase